MDTKVLALCKSLRYAAVAISCETNHWLMLRGSMVYLQTIEPQLVLNREYYEVWCEWLDTVDPDNLAPTPEQRQNAYYQAIAFATEIICPAMLK